jgi:hypothetical protein
VKSVTSYTLPKKDTTISPFSHIWRISLALMILLFEGVGAEDGGRHSHSQYESIAAPAAAAAAIEAALI